MGNYNSVKYKSKSRLEQIYSSCGTGSCDYGFSSITDYTKYDNGK